MTTMTTGPRGSRPAAEDDVYTVLVLISFLFALAATIFLVIRSLGAFDSVIPPGGA